MAPLEYMDRNVPRRRVRPDWRSRWSAMPPGPAAGCRVPLPSIHPCGPLGERCIETRRHRAEAARGRRPRPEGGPTLFVGAKNFSPLQTGERPALLYGIDTACTPPPTTAYSLIISSSFPTIPPDPWPPWIS
jgi:hypothetical protein